MPPEAAPPRVMPPAKRGKRHPAKRARLLTGALSALRGTDYHRRPGHA